MDAYRPVPLATYERLPEAEVRARANAFNALMQRRRSVRFFGADPVPRDIIETCLRVAGSDLPAPTSSLDSSSRSRILR